MTNTINIAVKHGREMRLQGFRFAVELARIAADNDQDIVTLLEDKLEEMEAENGQG